MLNIFDAILTIILTGLMGVMCGLFSYLLDFCFWTGNVFSFYLPWLASMQVKANKPSAWVHIKDLRDFGGGASGWEQVAISEAEGLFWYKVLGGCAVCLNVWIGLVSWFLICLFTGFEWYYGFPYVLTSSWLIRKLVGAVY